MYERGKVQEAVDLSKWLLDMTDELQSPKKSKEFPPSPVHKNNASIVQEQSKYSAEEEQNTFLTAV